MNTTVEALKSLYVDLGGSAADVADVTVIPDMIEAVAEVAKGGMAAEPFDVTVTLSSQTAGTADKSMGEIQAAIEAGKQIRFIVGFGISTLKLMPVMYSYNADGALIFINCVAVQTDGGVNTLVSVGMGGLAESKAVTAGYFVLSSVAG